MIVGASSGVGHELSKLFLSEKKKIITISRNYPKHLQNTDFKHFSFDITKDDFNLIENDIGQNSLEAVIFTVGFYLDNDDINTDMNMINKIFETNFLSITQFVKYLIERKKLKNNAAISFCSSVTTILPRDNQVYYCAAKKSLDSYIESLRFSFAKSNLNIFVNKFVIGILSKPMKGSTQKPSSLLMYETSKAAQSIFKNCMAKNKNFYVPFWWSVLRFLILLTPKFLLLTLLKKFKRS